MTVSVNDAARVGKGRAQARVTRRDGRKLMAMNGHQRTAVEFDPEHFGQTPATLRVVRRPLCGGIVVAADGA